MLAHLEYKGFLSSNKKSGAFTDAINVSLSTERSKKSTW